MSIAQVIKLKTSGDQFTYFLHYMGWNSRWDKWVVESDLMAAGPEALEMQKQLKDKKKKQKVGQRQRKHAFPASAWGTVFGIGTKQSARLEHVWLLVLSCCATAVVSFLQMARQ